ncbi:MAG: hypothetical protein GY933_13425 [Hyphomicrobiales bacterium]|nr:hypothetical protein [Hyphomicrobiales bacterium]
MIATKKWLDRFQWPQSLVTNHPLAIAHRGASAYRPENTLAAFRTASELASEMWELDIHLSADGVCVVAHDDDLQPLSGTPIRISDSKWEDICQVRLADGERVPRLDEVIDLARKTGSGLYIEMKGAGAGPVALRLLRDSEFRFAALGSFVVPWIAELRRLDCEFPLAVLVPAGGDPFEYMGDSDPDIIHLCWRDASDAPHDLVTDALIKQASDQGRQIVAWHEERLDIVDALLEMPLLGICSDRPEVLKPFRFGDEANYQIVCHRGASILAPENTLEAACVCLDQQFQFVEFDVRTTADGELIVIHDPSLERTTNGTGCVKAHRLESLLSLDAGSWYRDHAAGMRLPTLAQMLEKLRGRAGAYVEIKQADPARVLEAVSAQDMLDRCFFWSEDTDALRWMRRQSSDIVLMAPRWMYGSLPEAISDYDAQIIEFDATKDDLGEVGLCRNAGVRSMIFSLSHSWDDLAEYHRLGPDMVNLDRPDRFKIIAGYPLVYRHFAPRTGEP